MRLKHATKASTESGIPLLFIRYLAADDDRLSRFCGLTGLDREGLVKQLSEPSFQGFLLDYALEDESLLLAFCADTDLQPQDVILARRALPGYSQ